MAFAKLLQIICDPSMSAVSRKADNALVSATAKAKRMAAAHMPAIIAAFVLWTLDFGVRMDAEVREKLVPGWWAIFDVMSVEERKLLGEEMDRSGRDVLLGLVREWMKFGKWKGN
jgi:nucleolar pre-ribosomal-associated protein 2